MNLRQYKKKAKQAKAALIAEHGFRESDFRRIKKGERGEEALCVAERMDAHLWDYGQSIYPLRGTPYFLPAPVDYWGEANEPKCCVSMLREAIFWETFGNSIGRRLDREYAA